MRKANSRRDVFTHCDAERRWESQGENSDSSSVVQLPSCCLARMFLLSKIIKLTGFPDIITTNICELFSGGQVYPNCLTGVNDFNSYNYPVRSELIFTLLSRFETPGPSEQRGHCRTASVCKPAQGPGRLAPEACSAHIHPTAPWPERSWTSPPPLSLGSFHPERSSW